MLKRLPWITMLLTVAVALSPIGQSVIAGSWSSEQLARSISQMLLEIGLGIAAALILAEWLIRLWWLRRRQRTNL